MFGGKGVGYDSRRRRRGKRSGSGRIAGRKWYLGRRR